MARRVLLARPHMFIVEHMKPFLDGNGFEPVPLSKLSQARIDPTVVGIVISTALNSDVEESWVEAFHLLREQAPDTPIAMATMVPFAPMVRAFEVRLPEGLSYVDPSDVPDPAALGCANTVLVLQRDAIRLGDAHPDADRAVRAHFGGRAA